jgi:hypothetical protein
MAQQQTSSKPWSGANPIPNIQKFVENLDKDKKERDRQIDEQNQPSVAAPHKKETRKVSNWKTVTDPTTGKQVEIEDVGKEFMKAVKNPQV